MPKETSRKKKCLQKPYNLQTLKSALEAIQDGMSVREASKKFKIPKSTLFDKKSGASALGKRPGPPTVLTTAEENDITTWIVYCGEKGFPVTKELLLDSVRNLVIRTKKETPFRVNNHRPGRHWYESFMKRHPDIRKKVAQNLIYTRALATESLIRKWFSDAHSYLDEKGLLDIDSSRVFNCDESGLLLCPKAGEVLVRRGAKSVYKVANGDDKENLTTLFMLSANGILVPPMVVYKYRRVPYAVASKVPKSWAIGTSDNGWMTSQTFYDYMTNIFYPWLKNNQIQFPVVVFLDGHSSHLTLHLSNFCRTVGIELVALYPHSTHVLQPLDVALFHTLKTAWKHMADDWRLENSLRREDFAPLLKETIDSLDLKNIAEHGFKSCGLHPFCVDNVNFNVLNGNKDTRRESDKSLESCCENDPTTAGTQSPEQRREEAERMLNFFEQTIDTKLLENFQISSDVDTWLGDIEQKGLFLYWKQLKDKAELNNNQLDSGNLQRKPDEHISQTMSQVSENSSLFANCSEEIPRSLDPESLSQINDPPAPIDDNRKALPNVQEILQQTLSWPGTPKKKKSKIRKTLAFIPVITSDACVDELPKVLEDKKYKKEEVEERKRQRELAKIERRKQAEGKEATPRGEEKI